mgnify:CR=1 FL=1
MINFLLLLLAILLFLIFGTTGFVYSIVWRMMRSASVYFWQIAIAIDELGNTICQDLFNNTMRAKGGHKFGNSDETISHVLGKLKKENKLLPLGKALAWILNKIDENHVEDAVK